MLALKLFTIYMSTFLDEVLAASKNTRVRSFAVNEAGLALLRGGAQHLRGACSVLKERVVPVAEDTENPTALVSRFPGIDYVLQYLIEEGLLKDDTEVSELILKFPKLLLAHTLNIAARINSSAVNGKRKVIVVPQLARLAEAKLQDHDRHLRDAAVRYHQSVQ